MNSQGLLKLDRLLSASALVALLGFAASPASAFVTAPLTDSAGPAAVDPKIFRTFTIELPDGTILRGAEAGGSPAVAPVPASAPAAPDAVVDGFHVSACANGDPTCGSPADSADPLGGPSDVALTLLLPVVQDSPPAPEIIVARDSVAPVAAAAPTVGVSVPEPATLGLLIAGLGLAGALRRRKQS